MLHLAWCPIVSNVALNMDGRAGRAGGAAAAAAATTANKCRFFGNVHGSSRRPAICLRLPEHLSSVSDNTGPASSAPWEPGD